MMNTIRLNQLTGLRFVAALGVVLCHYAQVLEVPVAAQFFTNFLGSGVALFFVLSGFVLAYKYEAAWKAREDGGSWFRNYLCSRFARIMPLYWLSLLCMVGVFLVFGFQLSQAGDIDQTTKIWTFLLNAVALQAWVPDFVVQQYWNAPAWSVSSELFFYACFPWLLRVGVLDGAARSFIVLWGLMAFVLVGVFWLAQAAWAADPLRLYTFLAYVVRCPLAGLFCFALGIHLVRGIKTPRMQPRGGYLVAATAFVLVVAWAVARQKSAHAHGYYVEIVVVYLVYTPYFYLVLRYVLMSPGWLSRVLSVPAMVRLGDASYALYLLHWAPLCLLLSGPLALRQSPAIAAGTVVALILVSVGVFLWFEEPWRKRIRSTCTTHSA